jgi:hypothetical protein
LVVRRSSSISETPVCIVFAIMKSWKIAIAAIFVLLGCKGLKEQQLDAYVGDTQTKVVYKNVGANTKKVPEANRKFFRSVDEATGAGYTLSNEAGAGDEKSEDE